MLAESRVHYDTKKWEIYVLLQKEKNLFNP